MKTKKYESAMRVVIPYKNLQNKTMVIGFK